MELKNHLCKFCGQTDPKKFSKNHKSTCRKCATANSKKSKDEEYKLTQAAVDLIDSIQGAVSDIVEDVEKDLKKKFLKIIEDDREVYNKVAKKWGRTQAILWVTIGILAVVVMAETIYIVKPLLGN